MAANSDHRAFVKVLNKVSIAGTRNERFDTVSRKVDAAAIINRIANA